MIDTAVSVSVATCATTTPVSSDRRPSRIDAWLPAESELAPVEVTDVAVACALSASARSEPFVECRAVYPVGAVSVPMPTKLQPAQISVSSAVSVVPDTSGYVFVLESSRFAPAMNDHGSPEATAPE